MAPYNDIGKPITAIQIPQSAGGGPASSPTAKYYWGPSVSWNTYLNCWVMLMAKAEGPSWKGSSIYISFNRNTDLGAGASSQQWAKPVLPLDKSGHMLWYSSLQPLSSEATPNNKYSSLKMRQKARLFFKDNGGGKNDYVREYEVEFGR